MRSTTTFSEDVVLIARHLVPRAAADQGGVLSGINPMAFSTTDPIRVWAIQMAIILVVSQLLSLVMSRIRQPRVIAEVIGGIILGPTVMGRIPGFSETIFPPQSLPFLSLTATIGLVLFLFMTALEVDVRIVKRNAKASGMISLVGIAVPFGLGAAIAVPLYNTFLDSETVNLGHFILFVGVALSITAFPVLCRILTELKLLDTNVGVIVLSAGVGNDVIGWVLLALTVALVNASGGLTALWVLLASTGWTIFLLWPVKWGLHWLLRRTGSLENGHPTPFVIIVILLIVFISAFMTDILGVHAIFGGFIAGLIIPHDNGFAIALVEKMEDLVVLLLIPLYFALSGLRTNLGLLDSGPVWGYTILICATAFIGKFFGCAITARLNKFNLRESSAIGFLMSCKGLVELIVLNIGLQAGILDAKLFSMFVVMALVMTFITTPCVLAVYPDEHRTHEKPVIHKPKDQEGVAPSGKPEAAGEHDFKTRFSVVLNKIEHLPAIMTLTQLLQPVLPNAATTKTAPSRISVSKEEGSNALQELDHTPSTSSSSEPPRKGISIDALRLIELTDRTSAVMQSSEAEDLIHRDSLLSIYRTFGHINRIPVSASLAVVNHESFPSSVSEHAKERSTELVVIPWNSGHHSVLDEQAPSAPTYNPFDGIFGKSHAEKESSVVYSEFIRRVFATSPTDVALFVDRGSSHSGSLSGAYGQHILLPFFGGPDDRLALDFVVQLCASSNVTATVLRIRVIEDDAISPAETTGTDIKGPPHAYVTGNQATVYSMGGIPDTVYPQDSTQHRLESANADTVALQRYTGENRESLPGPVEDALKRITFEETSSAQPLHHFMERANAERGKVSETWKSLLIVTGRSRRMAVESHRVELRAIVREHQQSSYGGEVSRTVGDVAAACVVTGVDASLLVLQAADRGGPSGSH